MSGEPSWEQSAGFGADDDDAELDPSDFLSLGFAPPVVAANFLTTVSPTSIIDPFMPTTMMEQSAFVTSECRQSDARTIFEAAGVRPAPEFSSNLPPNHEECTLPIFDDTPAYMLDGGSCSALESRLPSEEMGTFSTPSNSHFLYKNMPMNPPGKHRNHLSENSRTSHIDPFDPVLCHLDFYPLPSSTNGSFGSSESGGDGFDSTVAGASANSAFHPTSFDTSPSCSNQDCEVSCNSSCSIKDDDTEEQLSVNTLTKWEPSIDRNQSTIAACDESSDTAEKSCDVSEKSSAISENRDNAHNVKNIKQQSCPRFSPSSESLIFIPPGDIQHQDVYCGQHERGSHRPGNVKFRALVAEKSLIYGTYASNERKKKTRMRDAIISKVTGRFLDFDGDTGLFKVLTRPKVNAKASQALRDGTKTKK